VKLPNTKQAEKEYLSRTGGGRWEREKPFSPIDTDTLAESVELLHDFSVAMKLLFPAPTDKVIDLGAGGGWSSDLLQRLNRTAIAVDISAEMLRVARTRAGRKPLLAVAGDLERLPFVDAAFDKALCLNALHHVPNVPVAVQEIARILVPDGCVVFSEPGRGHAEAPTSLAATRDFGVLEQEILIEPLADACYSAGFADVRVYPMSYVIPEFSLSVSEWNTWQKLSRRKRPVRAVQKGWKAFLELLGLGKAGPLFEEAFAMRLVRLLQRPIETHPFIVARKRLHGTARETEWAAIITLHSLEVAKTPDLPTTASLSVTNVGKRVWPVTEQSGAVGVVRLGVQLLDAGGKLIARDYARCSLPREVAPQSTVEVTAAFRTPAQGRYLFKFDLVAEGVAWFETTGTIPATVAVTVTR
jgi:SAM-dependent methyltransferase